VGETERLVKHLPVAQVPSVTQRDTTNNVEGLIRTNVASGSGVIHTQNGALASEKRGQVPPLGTVMSCD